MRRSWLPFIGAIAAISIPFAATAQESSDAPAVLVPVTPDAATLDPASLALARDIVAKIIPADRRQEMFKKLMSDLMQQLLSARSSDITDPGVQAIVDKHLADFRDQALPILEKHMPKLLEAIAHAYVREFSVDELRQIDAFADSAAGTHYLSRSADLLGDREVAQANREYAAEVYTLEPAMKASLANDLADYFKAHPPVPSGAKDRKAK